MSKSELKSLEARLYTIYGKIANCIGELPSINQELTQAADFIEKARKEVAQKIESK